MSSSRFSLKLKTQNPKPETRNPKPETRNYGLPPNLLNHFREMFVFESVYFVGYIDGAIGS